MKEIERKFIVKIADSVSLGQGVEIKQWYIELSKNKETRVRSKGESWFLTTKVGSGLVRQEDESEISSSEARNLLENKRDLPEISKTRYQLGRWEIDDFNGLFMAEIELRYEHEASPEIPSGIEIVSEVTGCKIFNNAVMAQHGVPLIWAEFIWETDREDSEQTNLKSARINGEKIDVNESCHQSRGLLISNQLCNQWCVLTSKGRFLVEDIEMWEHHREYMYSFIGKQKRLDLNNSGIKRSDLKPKNIPVFIVE